MARKLHFVYSVRFTTRCALVRKDIDDAVWLQVDGQQVLDDGGWNVVTTKSLELGRGGWFDFELRLHNAGGEAGRVTAPGRLMLKVEPITLLLPIRMPRRRTSSVLMVR